MDRLTDPTSSTTSDFVEPYKSYVASPAVWNARDVLLMPLYSTSLDKNQPSEANPCLVSAHLGE